MDLSRFNKAQREAIETTQGPLLILAGPGTGKTSVLIGKIQYLIESGVSAEQILAVTFSRKATFEMQERLDRAAPGLSERVTVSTLHAFCGDLVRKHGFRIGLQKRVRILTETDAKFFFRQMSGRLPIQPFLKTSNFEPVVDELLKLFQNLKDEGYWPEDILRFASSLPHETDDETKIRDEWLALGDLYNAHQSFCFEKGFVDFGDSIISAVRILQDSPMVKAEIHSQYKAILVDEFQDTNYIQTQLLRLLASDQCHTAVVGDDDQSIYQFRGASSSAFRFFEQAFEGTKVIELNETYRLPPEVVEIATTLIQTNNDRYRPNKILKSHKKSSQAVTIIKSPSYEDEAVAICDSIESLLNDGVSPGEVAILARSRGHTDLILNEAHRRKLFIGHSGSQNSFDSPIIGDAFAYLKLIVDPKDSVSFLRLLDSPILKCSSTEIYKFCRWVDRREPYIDALSKIEQASLEKGTIDRLSNFFNHYQENFARASKSSATDILFHLFESTKLIQSLYENDKISLKALAAFHEQLRQWEDLQDERALRKTLPLLELMWNRGDSLENADELGITRSQIPILTVHASKGLEFDHVFIVSMVNQRFPSRFQSPTWKIPAALQREESGTKEMQRQEERRLLYVAMTRAKESLTLSTVEKPYTKPSVFITEDLKPLMGSKFIKVIERKKNDELQGAFKRLTQPFRRAKVTQLEQSVAPKISTEPLQLSFSQLDKYENCPLAYEFQYEYRIPVSEPPQMAMGTAVHGALERFARSIQAGQKPSREDLLNYFEQEFEEVAKRSNELTELHHLQAKERLGTYFDTQPELSVAPLAVEQKFKLKIGEHTLSGKIDRVDRIGDQVRIIDYKTGKGKSSENSDDQKFADKSLQFSIYYLAATESLGWSVKELIFSYIYDNTNLATTRSKDDIPATKNRILEIASQIQQRNFEPKPGHQCRWCEFRRICPAAEF